ncbi:MULTISPECIES: IclR family transcriptional regulator [unclassified Haematobacter]|uniref:IclR family transcriptional regulator n=1 Tax=unclassified Haematobacter TaxID=2640585 RepID=UPI0025BA1A6C|nr:MULTISPECIES: IclR family transcriptional regulator [unclassified Haematobacter]
MTGDDGKNGGVAAVDRALSLLSAFGVGDNSLSLTELAARTGLYKSTALRLLNSLIQAEYVSREGDEYRIGREIFRLGEIYRRYHGLREAVIPAMQRLADATNESVVLHVREGDHRVCLHRIETKQLLRFVIREGDSLPLTVGAAGRVLLAFSGSSGAPYDTIRDNFFYASAGELSPDIGGIAAPVFGPGGALLAAMAVSGPASRITPDFIGKACPLLLSAAAEATSACGGDPAALRLAERLAVMRRKTAV